MNAKLWLQIERQERVGVRRILWNGKQGGSFEGPLD